MIKILILEDKQSDFEIINTELKRGKFDYEIQWVQNEESYIDAIKTFGPDIIISDYNLPSYDGIQAIKKAHELDELIPVIIVTGSINEDTAVECIKAGACDYVIKEHLKRLVPAIQHALSEKELKKIKYETELRLRESEETYRLLFEKNPHPMWVYDLDTLKILAVNDAAVKKYGYSKEEFLTLTLFDIRPEEDHELLINNIKKDQDELSFAGVWRHKAKDGKIFLVEIISHRISFNGKEAKLVLANDVTQRKRAEEKLINQLRIFDEVNDAIILTDANFKITFWNNAAEKIYGYKSEEVLGKNDIESLKTEFIDFNKNEFIEKLKAEKLLRLKLIQKNKNDNLVYIDSIVNLFYDVDGLINGYVSVNRDITKEKLIEFNLTAAKEKAEEANRLKTYFLNNISHELRTPLVPIITATELLLDEINDESQVKLVNSILAGGKRLNNTLSKILELIDLESLEGKIKLENYNLIEIINNELIRYEEKAKEKGLDFKVKYSDNEIISFTEKTFIVKILDHLIDNAINFTDRGFVSIEIDKVSNEWNIIKVKDSGVGIPIDKLEVIFEPFRQSSEGYNRKYEGTGLGLTLVKKYVELLNCEISVESIPNLGTTIELKIPTKEKEKENVNFNILFVDDDIDSLNIYRLILRNNYQYDLISSINEAKVIAANKNYDMIFLDINLSTNYTGFELLDYLRTYPNLKKTQFVALTAYASSRDVLRYKNAGFDKVLLKPFRKNDLIEIIENRKKEISKN